MGKPAVQICIVLLLTAARTVADDRLPYTTWHDYGGGPESAQYSALRQINDTNVHQLKLAWHFPVPDRRGNFGFNPLVVDGMMYVLGPSNCIVALNATNGEPIWSYRVEGGGPGNRGINYWQSKDGSDRRLIYASGGLRQLNARTGEPILTFGENGLVDMRRPSPGSPRTLAGPSSSPGRVFENLFIAGSGTGEGFFSPPGDIRAYDIVTGKLVWTFRTIPLPGDFGYETWPTEAWRYAGGVNCWGEISVDEKRGIAYIPLGSPTHDMFGGDRRGANLFGNCLLALDARTGQRLWHFQAVHHDLWDYDLVTGPKLLTVRHKGELVDIVAQPTKFGLLYVFNRVTGEPLWPIEELPVPKSDVPGEESWPTQPFPTRPPPFARLQFNMWDVNPYLSSAERASIQQRLSRMRNEGVFTPQTLDREQIAMPGELGGSNWGGAAADPETGMLFVRSADQPAVHRLRPQGGRRRGPELVGGTPEQRGRRVYTAICFNCHGEPEPGGIRTQDRTALIPVRELGNERIANVIRQGQNQMPAFPEDVMAEDTLQALLSYLANPSEGGRIEVSSSDDASDENRPERVLNAGVADRVLENVNNPEAAERVLEGIAELNSTNNVARNGNGEPGENREGRRGRGQGGGFGRGPQSQTAIDGAAHYPDTRYTGPLGSMWRATNGLPVISPPWSEIVAYDLNEGTIKWRVPFGTVPHLAAQGINNTGSARRMHRSPLAVTGGGLVFGACWGDGTVRAYNKENGSVLWEYAVQANPEGMIAIYEVNGRQYVAMCASGSARDDEEPGRVIDTLPGKASAQGYYVFALP